MNIQGRVIKYGDNIDTDAIIPARYLDTAEEAELAAHAMEDFDDRFYEKMKTASIIVAGENFGCGSSREHAPIALKAGGVACVVAGSFARIFYRNAINIGLTIVECKQAAADCADGDLLELDLDGGAIKNHTKNATYQIVPFPEFIQKLIAAGGLMNMGREMMEVAP